DNTGSTESTESTETTESTMSTMSTMSTESTKSTESTESTESAAAAVSTGGETPPESENPSTPPLTPEKFTRVMEKLEKNLTPRWHKANKTFMLDEIEEFAKQMRELGTEYGITILSGWGERLLKEKLHFDMEKVAETMDSFPDLVKEVAALVPEGDML
ncbi:MAG: hypothetical protein GY757_43590, partial [bacterium]|nr:hypothetical protein [bacterium]